jgi:hypothetical protein
MMGRTTHSSCRGELQWDLARRYSAASGSLSSIRLIVIGTDLAAGTLLRSAWCQSGMSGLHSG